MKIIQSAVDTILGAAIVALGPEAFVRALEASNGVQEWEKPSEAAQGHTGTKEDM